MKNNTVLKKFLLITLCFCLVIAAVGLGATFAKYAKNLDLEGFNLNILGDRYPKKIEITSQPDKTVYNFGDTFDPTGMVVSLFYSDGTKEVIEDYLIDADEPLNNIGSDTVVITYSTDEKTFTTELSITVNAKVTLKYMDDTTEDEILHTLTSADLPVPSRRGYTFDGWYIATETDGVITVTDETVPQKIKTNIIAAAKWTKMNIFAIYSATDTSLTFYCNTDEVTEGQVYKGKTATKIYTGFDNDIYTHTGNVPWYSCKNSITSVVVADKGIAPISTAYWFSAFLKCTSFDLTKLDTSHVTNMEYMFEFVCWLEGATSFKLDLSTFDTHNVTNMEGMFYSAGSASAISAFTISGLENWDVSSVTNMKSMFQEAGIFATSWSIGDLENWNVSSVTDMSHMFDFAGYEATKWSVGNIYKWNVSSVKNMSYMFSRAGASDSNQIKFALNLTGWDTSSVTDMSYMFYQTGAYVSSTFEIAGLSNWDVSSVTTMSHMFAWAGFNTLSGWNIGDLTNWDVSSVTDMSYMFETTGSCVTSVSWDIGTLNTWDTSSVTNMSHMFDDAGGSCIQAITLDLSSWDVSNVTDMSYMFHSFGSYSRSLDLGNLDNWDVGSVTSMEHMFEGSGCKGYSWNIGDISEWDVSSVETIESMFKSIPSVTNMDLSGWDVSSIANMKSAFSDSYIKALNLQGWDTSNAADMDAMFDGMDYLQEITISDTFSFTGDGSTYCVLPTPDSAYISHADGYWYNKDTKVPYLAVDIPSNHSATYSCYRTVFVVYSETDNSLSFYCNVDDVSKGSLYNDKIVTALYYGIESSQGNSPPWSQYSSIITSVVVVDNDIAPVSTYDWFCGFSRCATFDLAKLDTSRTTNMHGMFWNAGASVPNFELDVSNFDVHNVTSMTSMFYGAGGNSTSFKIIGLEDWDIGSTSMDGMFWNAGFDAKIWDIGDLSNWDTSNVTSMELMFYDAGANAEDWSIGDLSNWNTSSVRSMGSMFEDAGANAVTWSIGDICNWDTSNVTTMETMFKNAGANAENMVLNLSHWDTSNVTSMVEMFRGSGVKALDISNWNNSNAIMYYTFSDMTKLEKVTLGENFGFTGANGITCVLPTPSDEYIEGADGYWHNIDTGETYTSARVPSNFAATYVAVMPVVSYAVYSEDDGSLTFYSNQDIVVPGSTYNKKTVTAVYKNVDAQIYTSSTIPWAEFADNITSVIIDDEEISPVSTAYWFSGLSNCTFINLESLNTSSTTDMTDMFADMSRLEKVTLGNTFTFTGDGSTSCVLPTPNSEHVDGADGNWYSMSTGIGCSSAEIPSNTADTYVAIQMPFAVYSADDNSLMFYNRDELPVVGEVYNGKSVTEVFYIYERDHYSNNTEVPWYSRSEEIASVAIVDKGITPTSLAYWFSSLYYCSSIDVSNLDTSNVTSTAGTFSGAGGLSATNSFQIIGLDKWEVGSVTDMSAMFSGCAAFALEWDIGDLSSWDVSSVTNMSYMFNLCGSASDIWYVGDLSNWDVGSVTTMESMFNGAGEYVQTLNLAGIENWNTCSVEDMSFLFANTGYYSEVFSLDLSCWDVSSVTNMSNMFSGAGYSATTWTIGNLSKWDVSSVETMESMFEEAGYNAEAFNLDLRNWNAERLKTTYNMFYRAGCNASHFEVNVSGWDTGSSEKITRMFYEAGRYASTWTVTGLNTWDVSSVTDMSFTFSYAGNQAESFELDLSNWDTSSVTSMSKMFSNAGATALNLSGWDTSSACEEKYTSYGMTDMFSNMYRLEKITLGEKFSFTGNGTTSCVLPTPDPEYINNADGYWYNEQTGVAYTPQNVPSNVAATYVAYMPEIFYTAYAVYSETDNSLTFYNRSTVAQSGDVLEDGRVATNVYTGFDTVTYTYSFAVPWYGISNNVTSVVIADEGISPASTAYWFYGFKNCSSFDVSKLNMQNITNMSYMFYNAGYSTTEFSLDLSGWDTSNVTNMSRMFYNCKNLTTIYVSELWSTESVTSSRLMFYNCKALVGGEGTAYSSIYTSADRAIIDGGTNNPGYLTYKAVSAVYALYSADDNSLTFCYNSDNADIPTDGTRTYNGKSATVMYTDFIEESYTSDSNNGSNGHTHKFVIQDISDKYIVTAPTCTDSGEYYWSCACGEYTSQTFTVEPAGHSFNVKDSSETYLRSAATEAEYATYFYKCDNCDALGEEYWDDFFTISYELNGGANPDNMISTFTSNTETFELLTPSKEGYVFGGWFTNPDFSGKAVTQVEQGTTEDLVLYAKWIDKTVFAVYSSEDIVIGESQMISAMPDVAQLVTNAESSAPTGTTLYGWLVDSGMVQQIVMSEDLEAVLLSVYEEESEWEMTLTPLYQMMETTDSEETLDPRGAEILATAISYVGYEEGEDGYTTFGDHYDLPYEDWCAMFVSWCLEEHEIESVPISPSCAVMLAEAKEAGLFRAVDEYAPAAGDIVVFDYELDGLADHVGFVDNLDLEEGILHTVEGNYDNSVAEVDRAWDTSIVGYIIVTDNGEEMTLTVPEAVIPEQEVLAEEAESSETTEATIPAEEAKETEPTEETQSKEKPSATEVSEATETAGETEPTNPTEESAQTDPPAVTTEDTENTDLTDETEPTNPQEDPTEAASTEAVTVEKTADSTEVTETETVATEPPETVAVEEPAETDPESPDATTLAE